MEGVQLLSSSESFFNGGPSSSSSSSSEPSFLSLLMAPENNTDHTQYNPYYDYNFLSPPDNTDAQYNDYDYNFLSPPFPHQFPDYHLSSTLPTLVSLESPTQPPPPPQPSSDSYSLESILEECCYAAKRSKLTAEVTADHKKKTKKQSLRQKISDRLYCLGKQLPGGHRHRKKTEVVLVEAYNYIKFLQAQVSALKSMPVQSSVAADELAGGGGVGGGGGGGLAGLSRQEVLKVVVNSPAAQMVMAENGWCVVSAEQVDLINRIQARKKLIHTLLLQHPL